MSMPQRFAAWSIVACLLAMPAAAGAQDVEAGKGTIRGFVTDSGGRPLADVEVISLTFKRSTRTDASGQYVLAGLPRGEQLVMARTPGFLRSESIVTPSYAMPTVTLDFRLARVALTLDTVRVTARDTCPPYDFEGFDCRRRTGAGQFRGGDELAAIDATYFPDLFYGLEGIRVEPVRLGLGMRSTEGWRCIATGYNGRQITAAEKLLEPRDIAAIEYYATYQDVPEAYQRLAWPRNRAKPCSLVMYWTHSYIKHAEKQKRKQARKG